MIAITAFFAPPEQKIRKKNFRVFRQNLGIPLIVVEWSQLGEFQIDKGDCDHLIQLAGGDNLWQKEALLNIGINKARELGNDKIVLLDADVVFLERCWHKYVSEALDKHTFVQCFSNCHYLPPLEDYSNKSRKHLKKLLPTYKVPSVCKVLSLSPRNPLFLSDTQKNGEIFPGTNTNGNAGLAYAINLTQYTKTVYPFGIVGGGDISFLAAVFDRIDELILYRKLSKFHAADLRGWAQKNVNELNSIGFVNLNIFHLWHGDSATRNYINRWSILFDNNYDPLNDITVNPLGLLEFTEVGKRLAEPIEKYMISRKDG